MNPSAAGLRAIRADIGHYYSCQIARHGATPLGVGWTCVPTQELRFVQLVRLFDFSHAFSVNDVGCGYGALFGFLRRRHRKAVIDYLGLDLSQAMVDAARRRWRSAPMARFAIPGAADRQADYCVASGIFNVKLGHDRCAWEQFVADTLAQMYSAARVGVAVNFLQEDETLDRVPQLYRCPPQPWVEHCQRLGASVELRSGYGMPEFTLMLRRP